MATTTTDPSIAASDDHEHQADATSNDDGSFEVQVPILDCYNLDSYLTPDGTGAACASMTVDRDSKENFRRVLTILKAYVGAVEEAYRSRNGEFEPMSYTTSTKVLGAGPAGTFHRMTVKLD